MTFLYRFVVAKPSLRKARTEMLKNVGYLALPLSILIAVAWFSTYVYCMIRILFIFVYVHIIITLNIFTDFLQSMAIYQLSNMKLTSLNISRVDW